MFLPNMGLNCDTDSRERLGGWPAGREIPALRPVDLPAISEYSVFNKAVFKYSVFKRFFAAPQNKG